MRKASATASAFLLALMCAGCGSGFGFHAGGPEMPRLRQVLALKEGMVVADVGAGKGQLTLALAGEVGSRGRVFSTEIDPARLARLREAAGRAGLGNVTVVEAQSRETGLPSGVLHMTDDMYGSWETTISPSPDMTTSISRVVTPNSTAFRNAGMEFSGIRPRHPRCP